MLKLISLLLGLMLLVGCRSVKVDLPDGRKVEYINIGFDTKLGLVEVETTTGAKLRIENVDSSSQGLVVAGKALDLVNKVADPLP